jgi:hypothetical protein
VNKATLVTPYVSFKIKDDILYVVYLPGVTITLDAAKDIVKKRLLYTENVPYRLIVSGEGLRAVDKEARSYLSNEGAEGVIAGVLLVNSIYTEFFGNFFLNISKPKNPSKLFTNEQEALKWLEQFKPKY